MKTLTRIFDSSWFHFFLFVLGIVTIVVLERMR